MSKTDTQKIETETCDCEESWSHIEIQSYYSDGSAGYECEACGKEAVYGHDADEDGYYNYHIRASEQ